MKISTKLILFLGAARLRRAGAWAARDAGIETAVHDRQSLAA